MRITAAETVGIVILTCGRITLRRSIESIITQDYVGPISLLLICDNCPGVVDQLPSDFSFWSRFKTVAVRTIDGNFNEPIIVRVAKLRNLAVSLLSAPFVAFLDDDNAWMPNHLSSLVETMLDSNYDAVHSWRQFRSIDGNRWTPNRFPWLPVGTSVERRLFFIYRQLKVFRDDCIVRDNVSLPSGERDYGMVDMGEWLFRHEVLRRFPFDVNYSRLPHFLPNRRGVSPRLY